MSAIGCDAIGAIDKGKKVHDEILRQGLLEHHIVLGAALMNMYAKCGALCQAQSVLEKLPSCDVSWNALIAGYGQNKQGQQDLDCFEQMQCGGILTDEGAYDAKESAGLVYGKHVPGIVQSAGMFVLRKFDIDFAMK